MLKHPRVCVAEWGGTCGVLWGSAEGDEEGAEEGDRLGDQRPPGSPQRPEHDREPEVRRLTKVTLVQSFRSKIKEKEQKWKLCYISTPSCHDDETTLVCAQHRVPRCFIRLLKNYGETRGRPAGKKPKCGSLMEMTDNWSLNGEKREIDGFFFIDMRLCFWLFLLPVKFPNIPFHPWLQSELNWLKKRQRPDGEGRSWLPLLAALRRRNSDGMRFTTLVGVGIITVSDK